MTAAPASNGNGYINRGNMTVMISAAGLVMLAFGGFITFQNGNTDRRLSDIREDIKGMLRKDEHEEFKLRIDKDLTAIHKDIVPRTEHEARWEASEKEATLLAARLNELRTSTTSTYTLRDEVSRLQTEISELRRVLSDRGTNQQQGRSPQ